MKIMRLGLKNISDNDQMHKALYKRHKRWIDVYVDALAHFGNCESPQCTKPMCVQIKTILEEIEYCKAKCKVKRHEDRCRRCILFSFAIKYHAKFCENTNCTASFCNILNSR